MTRYVSDESVEKNDKLFGGYKLAQILRMWADAEDQAEVLTNLYRTTRDPNQRHKLFIELNGLGNYIEDDLQFAVLLRIEAIKPESQEPKPIIRRKKVK